MNELEKLCQDLKVPLGNGQDWEYELANEYRTPQWLAKYLSAYLHNNYSTFQKHILMNLCIDICNDLFTADPNQNQPIIHQVLNVLYNDYAQHWQLIDYWALPDEPLEDCFEITSEIRKLRQKYLANAHEWLALNQAQQNLLIAKQNFRQCPDFFVQLQIALNSSSQQTNALTLIHDDGLNDDQLSQLLSTLVDIALEGNDEQSFIAHKILVKNKNNQSINQNIANLLLINYIDDLNYYDEIIYRRMTELLYDLNNSFLIEQFINRCKNIDDTEVAQNYHMFAEQLIPQISTLSEDELKQIQKRSDNVTFAPLQVDLAAHDHISNNFISLRSEQQRNKDIKLIDATDAEYDFIVHARQDIPKLLNEIRRLKTVINKK